MSENRLPGTLLEAVKYFDDPDTCQEFLAAMRWPDGVVKCPQCGRDDPRYLANARLWECRNRHPRNKLSIKVGTIFEDSPLPLSKWLPAVWMVANDKNGISSYELHRAVGVTQKSAWFMLSRIRLAMQDENAAIMSGTVEADETFVGGKAKFMHGSKRAARITHGRGGNDKAMVAGLLERHDGETSRVKAAVKPNRLGRTLLPFVRENVTAGTEVFTDALFSYRGLSPDYVHEFVDHAEEYVRDRVHRTAWRTSGRCSSGRFTGRMSRSSRSTCSATSMKKHSGSMNATGMTGSDSVRW